MEPQFVHLHLHSEFSLVDGLIRPKALVAAAAEAGMPAVAVTDLTNLFCLVRFYKAAMSAGVKPIVGSEFRVEDPADALRPHRLVLLVQDLTGYRNLTRLISRAYLERQDSGFPRLDRSWLDTESTAGLIALSAGHEGDLGQALVRGHRQVAEQRLDDWLGLFGERFYLELTRTGRPDEDLHIEAAVELAVARSVPVVATNDVRFLCAEDFEAHEVRVCIHEGLTLEDPRRPRPYTPEQYLRTPAEMAELFADLPEALENSVEIARRCNLELELGKSYLPESPIPAGQTVDEFITEASRRGLEWRLERTFDPQGPDFAEQRRPYDERLATELKVIGDMGFPGYFLIVADFIQWAKDQGIPVGPGRGSGAGSLVAYALKITDLDPIEHDLLFERFLNPERVSMPDFDVDFCMERRDEVIDYVADKYGREAVSQIITFGTMAAKAVVRDVGRVLGHPYGFVDKIAKMVPFELKMTLDKALVESEELKTAYAEDEAVTALIDMARKLEGLARNAGKHAGGVVIAPGKLTDFAPLYCEPGGENLVTQFDKDDVEQAGLVKFDFLGLRTLTIIDWALKTVNARRAEQGEAPLQIEQINPRDPTAFALLKRCATTAVFQLESRGMKELIKKLQPDCFEDITALVALFRPGPLQSGMVDDFIDRKHGRAAVAYPHPDLEPILKPTYGVILYQEQVMQIAQVLAGYSLGGADILRRCLAGSTEVVDALTGRRVTLTEIAAAPEFWIGRDVFALDLNNQKITRQPIEAIYRNGVQEVFEIKTRTGRCIQATANHLFYTLIGWKPLSAFQPGDRIGLAGTLPIKQECDISEAQIKLTAYLLGDGHLSTKQPANCYFCNTDPELIADFNCCVEKLFGRPAPVDYQQHSGRKTVGYVRVGFLAEFNVWIDSHIQRAHSRDKVIPDWVDYLSKDQLCLFIGTLWSTDGSFDISIGHADYNSISYRMIKRLQHLLLRLGIIALFNIKNSQYQGQPYCAYRAQITGREEMLKFHNMICPFLSHQKQKRFDLCYQRVHKKLKNQSKHSIPAEVIGLIADAKYSSGMTWAEIDLAAGLKRGVMSSGLNFKQLPKRALSRHRVLNFANALNNERLYNIATSEVFWDVIDSICLVGQVEVFDLTIPQHHNFIANDFIAHNCMGKKKPEEMAQQREIFLKGAVARKIKNDTATYIFDLMEKFAGYGFNKSHSAAYALVSYQTLWLKAHYPAAFMAAVLSADMDNTDKVVTLIDECRAMKLVVDPPCINGSQWRFTVADERRIVYGLGAIKGVGESAIENILAVRQPQPFADLWEFCRRVDPRRVNRRVIEALIRAGALDQLGGHRAALFNQLPVALKLAEQAQASASSGQNDLFGMGDEETDTSPDPQIAAEEWPEWDEDERLRGEKETLGLYLTGHPIDAYESELKAMVARRIADLLEGGQAGGGFGEHGEGGRGESRTVVGLVVSVRVNKTARGRMASVTLDDRTGRIEATVFSELFEQTRELLVPDSLLVVSGQVLFDRFRDSWSLRASAVRALAEARAELADHLRLTLDLSDPENYRCGQQTADALIAALQPFCGAGLAVRIDYRRPGAKGVLQLGEAWRVTPADALIKQLRQCLGTGAVDIIYQRELRLAPALSLVMPGQSTEEVSEPAESS